MPVPAESFAGGDGSEENPFQISTPEELYRFSYVMDPTNFDLHDEEFAVEFRKMHYVLTEDIALNDVSDYDNWLQNAPENGWAPISSFQGLLGGAGRAISGLYCYEYRTRHGEAAGLFNSIIPGAVVENLNLDKCMIIATSSGAGAITESASGAYIQNYSVNGTVMGHVYAVILQVCLTIQLFRTVNSMVKWEGIAMQAV